MITGFDIYMLGIVPGVHSFLKLVMVTSFVAVCLGLLTLFISVISDNEFSIKGPVVKQFTIKSLILMLFTAFIMALLPSQRVIAAMYVIPQLEQSQVIKNIPTILLKLENQYITKLEQNTIKHATEEVTATKK